MRTMFAILSFLLFGAGLATIFAAPLAGVACWVGGGICLLLFQHLSEGKDDAPPDSGPDFIDKF